MSFLLSILTTKQRHLNSEEEKQLYTEVLDEWLPFFNSIQIPTIMKKFNNQYMTVFIGSLVATEERSHASSRLMRIVADLIVRNCLQRMAKSNRTSTVKEVISVQKQDVAMFTEAFVAGVMNERKRIGFI